MDITLSDVLWVVGGLIAFVAVMVAWERRAAITQAVSGVFGRYVARRAGSGRRRSGSGTGSAALVPQQQHQAAPAPVLDFAAVLNYLKRHKLSDDEAIDLLTLAHRESGELLSANKIRDIVGGNEKAVKDRVASLRPKPPAPRPPTHVERPANGWH